MNRSFNIWSERPFALRSVLIVSALALAIMIAGCGDQSSNKHPSDSLQRIVQSGELKVGYVVVPPWIIKDPNTGSVSGSSVESIQEIARLAGLKLTLVEASWTTFVSGLQTGQYDLSIVPAYVTVGRAKVMSFTRPISYTGNTALIRTDDSRFAALKDLDQPNITVAVTQGTQDHEFALKFFTRATVKAVQTQDIPILFTEVATGRADAALADTYNVRNFVKAHPEVRELTPGKPYNILPAAWTVRYEDVSLRQFLNSSLDYLEGNGILRLLDEKYQVPNDKPY
jgi:polar amino acid transport system substrate-binding protein